MPASRCVTRWPAAGTHFRLEIPLTQPDDKAPPPASSGPVAWFERLLLLGADLEKINKAIVVPTFILLAPSMFVPALAKQAIDPGLSFQAAVAATFPLTMAIAVIWISTYFWDRSRR